eukprot:Blabericola_migrator_1__518@NODE_1127_length_5348_cov_10_812914_g769_i0_p1_GENE_NODE_1127_length_5348_cov_10_812914_g769_i0NODE_1127_length_5348_cov_10_812914_g769_i0_p1_ORF_typecomplete_len1262_score240_58MitMem_reg/PF13012_6/1_5e02MitMem_reg/PF13012_6/4_7DdrB/PF12747_7/0_58THOC7/PF05615_13/66THOC7/PF05615_13/29_NODE_1127_length_5348_cov_10_812914_g769_i07934578
MTRTGRYPIKSYNNNHISEKDAPTSKTLSLGVCCVLSMYAVTDVAGGPIRPNPVHSLEPDSTFQRIAAVTNQTNKPSFSLPEDELISTFCKTHFSFLPSQDQSDWIQRVQSTFEHLNFVSPAASEFLRDLNACLNEIESTLLEAGLEKKAILTEAEVTAIQNIQNLLGQIEDAITKFCPEAYVACLRKSITKIRQYCQRFETASSNGTAEAWHKRAKPLLGRASAAYSQRPVQPAVWDRLAEVLREAESTLDTRSFSDDEMNTFNEITKVAAVHAPVYPCVADCAKVWYKLSNSQERPHNAKTVSSQRRSLPVADTEGVEAPTSECKKHQRQPQTSYHNPGAVFNPPLFDTNFWTLPVEFSASCDASTESLRSEKVIKHFNSSFHGLQLAVLPHSESKSAKADPEKDWEAEDNDAIAAVGRSVAKFLTVTRDAIHENWKPRSKARLFNARERINELTDSLSQLSKKQPPLDAQSLALLDSMCSSLTLAKASIQSSRAIRMSNRYMTKLNNAIFIISHLRHLAKLQTQGLLRPQELENFEGVTCFPKEPSSIGLVAFTSYAVLLTTDSDEEGKEFVNDFMAFFDLVRDPIDLNTAKTYLLILLYLKHEKVKLIGTRLQNPLVQDPLDKLISRLRNVIFKSNKAKVPLRDIPEFEDFHSTYFGASTAQTFDWRDSLRLHNTLAQDKQRPIILKLVEYGNSFRVGLNQLTNLDGLTPTCANQLKRLKAFRRHLLGTKSTESVFADAQTLAYLKQFAAFATSCLNECRIEGLVTCPDQRPTLSVTLDCLHWCRLLSSYLEVPLTRSLEDTYNIVATALTLKSLWSHQSTASLFNSERASISQGILTALSNNKFDNKLLVCTKLSLDKNVPSRCVKIKLDELLLDKLSKDSDHDKMVKLLALECRMQSIRAEMASNPNLVMPLSIKQDFTEALIQARLSAKGVHILAAPSASLCASLQERFVASPAHEAAQHLSVDDVLKKALERSPLSYLTVSDVAHHLATYLLGDPVDEQWLDFLTCQVKWCSFTPQELTTRQGELTTLLQSLETFLKVFCHKFGKAQPFDVSVEASPDLIRHFVNMAALKWLFGKLLGESTVVDDGCHSLKRVASGYFFAWIPKWLVLMHSRQALFPPDVIVDAEFFNRLCVNMSRQVSFTALPKSLLNAPLDNSDASSELRHCLKGLAIGTLTKQDFETLMEPHASPVISALNRDLFLTFLLYVWHHKRLPQHMSVVQECIKIVIDEGAQYEGDDGMSVSTMQKCIGKLLDM